MQKSENYVFILVEVEMHPHSYLTKFLESFEIPSVVYVTSTEKVRRCQAPPVFDSKYLMIFESFKVFSDSVNLIRLETMFPLVVLRRKSALREVIEFCNSKQLPSKYFINDFTRMDAYDLIAQISGVDCSKSVCDAILSKTKLSPKRIASAVMVCCQVGFTVSNINKYVDKYIYTDTLDAVLLLLGKCKSKAQYNRALMYFHNGRVWHNRVKLSLSREIDMLLQVFYAILDGSLTSSTIKDFDASIPTYKVLGAIELFDTVSIVELLALKQFVVKATPLDFALRTV